MQQTDKQNRLALITGGSCGIGAEFARQLASQGCDIIIVSRREETLIEMCEVIQNDFGVKADYIIADLSDYKQTQSLAEKIKTLDNLEILVNNAGFGTQGEFLELPVKSHLDMLRVHCEATVALTHSALPAMVNNRRGGVINVSSVSAYMFGPEASMYCGTKAFLNAFSESVALEVKESGVTIQALCPGYTLTEFHQRLGINLSKKALKHFMSAEEVVACSLRYFKRGRVICIPGFGYKLIHLLIKIMPASLMRRISRKRKKKE
jgi:hypothetical protein